MRLNNKILEEIKSVYSDEGVLTLSEDIEQSYSYALNHMSGCAEYNGFIEGLRKPSPEHINSSLAAAKNMYCTLPTQSNFFTLY